MMSMKGSRKFNRWNMIRMEPTVKYMRNTIMKIIIIMTNIMTHMKIVLSMTRVNILINTMIKETIMFLLGVF